MISNNNLDDKLASLTAIMGEYLGWLSGVSQHLFYDAALPPEPAEFVKWADTLTLEEINIDGKYIARKDALLERHNKLVTEVASLGHMPSAEKFSAFMTEVQTFISDLRVFCQSIVLEEWGLDVLTGLKNNAIVKKDLAIELERLSREGYPFCIGLARIDDFAEIENSMGPEKADAVVKTVAGLVQQSLRSYDDAYRIERDHFVMCLKQSDIVGGQKALERLRDILEKAGEVYEINGKQTPLSLSCCVAAPLPGDDIDDLLDNLDVDLGTQIKDHGAVLTYQELSPLQRFIQKEKD